MYCTGHSIDEDIDKHLIKMNFSEDCIHDVKSMVDTCIVPNIADITGYDAQGKPLSPRKGMADDPGSTNAMLVAQGKKWAEHVQEPWCVLVLAGTYIIFSVGLNLPIFGLFADAIKAICIAGGSTFNYQIAFTPRIPSIMNNQPAVWTIIGLIIQFVDAIWFVFIIKIFVLIDRWMRGTIECSAS